MTSAYLKAGSPVSCFLPSCHKPFEGSCVHGNDGHFFVDTADTVPTWSPLVSAFLDKHK